jgi:lipopolysaccharide heptosyltransferase III
MEPPASNQRPLRYRLDRLIRAAVMRLISSLASGDSVADFNPRDKPIRRILLVRANFRIGNAILTLPAVAAFHKNFPDAKIDFVGSAICRSLFAQQPLAQIYETPRRFPQVLWQYVNLIRQLRAHHYDLAVELSCSQSGLGAFVVGLSGARVRAGCAGKWDRLFDLKIAKLRDANKYRKLYDFLTALRLESIDTVGALKFSSAEVDAGRQLIEATVGKASTPVVGVFVGGRKLRGKRWPLENFVAVSRTLTQKDYRVIVFLGPEEADIAAELRLALGSGVPIVCEPSLRKFAAAVSHLQLFICCDSGPMHLACTLGTRVLAIFQERDVARWAPPVSAARVVSAPQGVSAADVLQAAFEELTDQTSASASRRSQA